MNATSISEIIEKKPVGMQVTIEGYITITSDKAYVVSSSEESTAKGIRILGNTTDLYRLFPTYLMRNSNNPSVLKGQVFIGGTICESKEASFPIGLERITHIKFVLNHYERSVSVQYDLPELSEHGYQGLATIEEIITFDAKKSESNEIKLLDLETITSSANNYIDNIITVKGTLYATMLTRTEQTIYITPIEDNVLKEDDFENFIALDQKDVVKDVYKYLGADEVVGKAFGHYVEVTGKLVEINKTPFKLGITEVQKLLAIHDMIFE